MSLHRFNYKKIKTKTHKMIKADRSHYLCSRLWKKEVTSECFHLFYYVVDLQKELLGDNACCLHSLASFCQTIQVESQEQPSRIFPKPLSPDVRYLSVLNAYLMSIIIVYEYLTVSNYLPLNFPLRQGSVIIFILLMWN